MIRVDARRDVNVHSDIDVGELRVNEWVYRRRPDANASLKAAGGDGHAATDIELGWLPVNRTNFRILNNFGGGVRQNEIRRGTWQSDGVIGGAE
jgi:hypothetical protein